MASSSSSTSAASCPGGIEALQLKVGPVRRNLFGPVDHQQLQKDFQRVLHVGVEVANKRWNFDFQKDKPGPGPTLEWEKMSCQEVPAFYRSCIRPAHSGAGFKRRSSASSGDESTGSSSSSSEEDCFEVTTRECYRLPSGKRKQAVITDFFKVKKRRLLYYKGSLRQ